MRESSKGLEVFPECCGESNILQRTLLHDEDGSLEMFGGKLLLQGSLQLCLNQQGKLKLFVGINKEILTRLYLFVGTSKEIFICLLVPAGKDLIFVDTRKGLFIHLLIPAKEYLSTC